MSVRAIREVGVEHLGLEGPVAREGPLGTKAGGPAPSRLTLLKGVVRGEAVVEILPKCLESGYGEATGRIDEHVVHDHAAATARRSEPLHFGAKGLKKDRIGMECKIIVNTGPTAVDLDPPHGIAPCEVVAERAADDPAPFVEIIARGVYKELIVVGTTGDVLHTTAADTGIKALELGCTAGRPRDDWRRALGWHIRSGGDAAESHNSNYQRRSFFMLAPKIAEPRKDLERSRAAHVW